MYVGALARAPILIFLPLPLLLLCRSLLVLVCHHQRCVCFGRIRYRIYNCKHCICICARLNAIESTAKHQTLQQSSNVWQTFQTRFARLHAHNVQTHTHTHTRGHTSIAIHTCMNRAIGAAYTRDGTISYCAKLTTHRLLYMLDLCWVQSMP